MPIPVSPRAGYAVSFQRGCPLRESKRRAVAGPSRSVSIAENSAPKAKACEVVEVDLGQRTYPIYIGRGLLDNVNLLKPHIKGRQVLVVTNDTVAPLYLERCQRALQGFQVSVAQLPDGEEFKDVETVSRIWDKALQNRLNRQCTFLALGGGVIGDMTGFAAASYQRGVNFIQIPTTVMATVDSSVGGKTGVNHALGKNMIGAFHQPQCVLIDTETLVTLPARQHASGISEIIKYGLIKDAELFEWLENNIKLLLEKDPQAMAFAIQRSCINKADVVAMDEREGGIRATLNLGHTFGHAIETWQGYGKWLHGEAVAAGIVMAADLSLRLGWIDQDLFQRAQQLIERAGLPSSPPKGMLPEDFLELMAVDKKAIDGQMRLVLLKGALGNCVVTSNFERAALTALLDAFCA